ncbi:L-rhamnose isomerase [Nibricoccus aquaticus]|uniref:L-rhamnose isomerase n=1 Tax=Nibricoccus aquaticus TaxID=2576891 RepID=A0A290QDH6_9BACT|nr:L-rhamnose isomerase [Nibricoccus aquaticus]ATC63378.1 L-rhamnose isomerase [Nibricoccus aquaticus]
MDAFNLAKERYAELGVDVEKSLQALASTPISLQCWQGDDVAGSENPNAALTGGIQATGNYPGKARNLTELRADLDQAIALIPGHHRVNLHACYADLGGKKVERNAYTIEQFASWVDWAKPKGLGLDFNPTYFSHALSADGFTLSHRDAGIRKFWIEHGIACRHIAAEIGKRLGKTVISNVWIPDGFKDTPVNRREYRERLEQSLDAVFAPAIDPALNRDAVESKLFGIGSESCVIGSHEFYLGYAVKKQKIVCLDAGHFHPTETLADKISSTLQFVPEVLLHVSRGVRWDSDHVVTLDDQTKALMEEIVRGDFLKRVHIGMDFFDASINRLAAWVIGARNTQKALLLALLEPTAKLRALEAEGDFSSRLAILEEAKALPFGAVWDEFCKRNNVPTGHKWLETVKSYEKTVLANRK